MDNLNRHFGLVIAYLLPGFVALVGLAPLSPTVAGWLAAGAHSDLGTPVYALLAAMTAGMVVSCFRWLVIDQVHAVTGLGSSRFDARALEAHPTAFSYLIEQHYRYYQFYANVLVAVVWAYAVHRWRGASPLFGVGTDAGVVILSAVLFLGSRDALSKYRRRSGQLNGHV